MRTKTDCKQPIIHFIISLLLTMVCSGCITTVQVPSPRHTGGDWIPSDSVFTRYLQQERLHTTHNNEMKLLASGSAKFTSLFDDIRKAKHHIHLEYFNFRNDSIANTLFDLLAEKVQEGVKVRAMFDAFGNMSNNRPIRQPMMEWLRAKGIEIVTFDPIRFPWVNHVASRDHQKIVVIDGHIGYTGGMNIADYYINGLPEIGEWHDMHLRLEGPAVEDLQRMFLTMWNKETHQQVDGTGFFPFTEASTYQAAPRQSGRQVAILQRRPNKAPATIRHAYIAAMDAAEHSIRIINPYFTPTVSIRRAIRRAVRRGVRVDIMIPGKSDIPFTPDAAFYIANRLRKAGAHVYVYNGGFHHSKTMTVDGRFCTVGSTNLNARSLRYDYEVNAFIMDLPLTDELDRLFDHDRQNSTVLTHDTYRQRGHWKRFVGWFAHLFTPVL